MFGFMFNKPKKKGDESSESSLANGKVQSLSVTELPQTPSVRADANNTEVVVPEKEREQEDQSEEQVAPVHTSHPPPGENAVGDPDNGKYRDAKEGTDDYFSKEQDAKKQKKFYSPENELFDAYDYV